MKLNALGFTKYFQEQVETSDTVGRVIKYAQNIFTMMTETGIKTAELKGTLRHAQTLPKIGDFVLYDTSDDGSLHIIYHILSRRTCLTRKEAGSSFSEQIVASNMDYLFLVMSLNDDFNMRRLERFLVGAWESGAEPLVILTKKDLCDNLEERLAMVDAVTFGVKTLAISALKDLGLEQLDHYNEKGKTIALVGSSGVGKSTLINKLAGKEVMAVDGLRNDDKGHHTTTHREMIFTDGAILIDTPGMREFGVSEAANGLSHEFEDIESLMASCRFSDCQHNDEPGCKIAEALVVGTLDSKRYNNYLLLVRESLHMAKKIKQKANVQAAKIAKKQRKSKPRKKTWGTTID